MSEGLPESSVSTGLTIVFDIEPPESRQSSHGLSGCYPPEPSSPLPNHAAWLTSAGHRARACAVHGEGLRPLNIVAAAMRWLLLQLTLAIALDVIAERPLKGPERL